MCCQNTQSSFQNGDGSFLGNADRQRDPHCYTLFSGAPPRSVLKTIIGKTRRLHSAIVRSASNNGDDGKREKVMHTKRIAGNQCGGGLRIYINCHITFNTHKLSMVILKGSMTAATMFRPWLETLSDDDKAFVQDIFQLDEMNNVFEYARPQEDDQGLFFKLSSVIYPNKAISKLQRNFVPCF